MCPSEWVSSFLAKNLLNSVAFLLAIVVTVVCAVGWVFVCLTAIVWLTD